MVTIFMNSENSKTSESHRFKLDLADKPNLKDLKKHVPSDAEKSLLVSFALAPKQLSYSYYLISFELFYRSIDNLKILPGDNLDSIKTRI